MSVLGCPAYYQRSRITTLAKIKALNPASAGFLLSAADYNLPDDLASQQTELRQSSCLCTKTGQIHLLCRKMAQKIVGRVPRILSGRTLRVKSADIESLHSVQVRLPPGCSVQIV